MKTLSVGIGCRSGSTALQIEQAVNVALGACFGFDQISVIASIDTKAREPGLIEFCSSHALPLRLFSREEIAAIPVDEQRASARARGHLGVDGVCEPCALLGALSANHDAPRLVLHKHVLNGVTVAIATSEASPSHDNQDLP